MPVLTSKKAPQNVSDDLAQKPKDIIIKRVGKDIVFMDNEVTQVLSGNAIKSIANGVIRTNPITRIRTLGLSKAQVEKIAGSFVRVDSSVEVRHASRNKNIENQLQRFEIVVKGGKKSV